ncbi:hypothetical protein ACFQS6_01020 [Xanthomonas populi]|uniref:hypothetical protein n=1 Tax=Xanthomonas populi TaxID=53414 RepID=UPI000FF8904C|nr:hypothetical protein [Xanthomonas populi]
MGICVSKQSVRYDHDMADRFDDHIAAQEEVENSTRSSASDASVDWQQLAQIALRPPAKSRVPSRARLKIDALANFLESAKSRSVDPGLLRYADAVLSTIEYRQPDLEMLKGASKNPSNLPSLT